MEQYITAGIDLGNGYVKAVIDKFMSSEPSLAAKQFNTSKNLPLTDDAVPDFMENIWDNMDLSFSSPLVTSMERRLFGERALKSGLTLEEFNVYNHVSKADVDLSGVLALATLASDALKAYYKTTGQLPTETVELNVNLAVALPIREYAQHAPTYRQNFLNGGASHMVTFHNFKTPVRFAITIANVMIINEGESAQYGLYFSNERVQGVIEQEAKRRYTNGELADATGRDLVQAKNTLGIDIGEGTIDFAVFSNGRFNPDSSTTLNAGYGTVLETTLGELQQQNHPYKSRKELAEFLNSEPGVFARQKHNHVKEVNAEQERRFAVTVANKVTEVFSNVGSFTEVIFIYGGGATPLEWVLFEEVKKCVEGFGANNFVPIVYLDSMYSRYLNVQGLYEVAARLGKKAGTTV